MDKNTTFYAKSGFGSAGASFILELCPVPQTLIVAPPEGCFVKSVNVVNNTNSEYPVDLGIVDDLGNTFRLGGSDVPAYSGVANLSGKPQPSFNMLTAENLTGLIKDQFGNNTIKLYGGWTLKLCLPCSSMYIDVSAFCTYDLMTEV